MVPLQECCWPLMVSRKRLKARLFVRRLAGGELPVGMVQLPISNMAEPTCAGMRAHVLRTHVRHGEHVCTGAHAINVIACAPAVPILLYLSSFHFLSFCTLFYFSSFLFSFSFPFVPLLFYFPFGHLFAFLFWCPLAFKRETVDHGHC